MGAPLLAEVRPMTWTAEDQAAADLAREVLGTLGPIDIRRMFGGAGIYLHGIIFAIILDGEIPNAAP